MRIPAVLLASPLTSLLAPAVLALAVLALAVLAPAATAQGDFAYDKTSTATLGGVLKLDYKGAPASKPMMFMLSTNGGPTPLKLMFGGTDTRSVDVGVDLVATWLLLATSATGNGGFNLGVPNLASLQGQHVHLQLMTGGGTGPNIVDKISNKIVIVAGAGGTSSVLASKLGDGRTTPVGRAMMSASPIAGGNVLLAGGGTGNILDAKGLKTTEIYDFRTMASRPGPDMTKERALHTATVLKDGRLLIAGGVDGGTSSTSGVPLATCEIYDPKTNKFTATGSMGVARAGHGATLLNDGRVLVAAGTKALDINSILTAILNTCEVYDPSKGTWSAAASIKEKVIGPSLTTLANGKVLVAGGAKITLVPILNIPVSVDSVTTCQIYTPSTTGAGSWASTGSMKNHRCLHTTNTIRLKDGRVLVTGGVSVYIPLIPFPTNFNGAQSTAKSEYYNPTSGTWVALPDLADSRFGHSASEMPNGRVLVAGGGKGAVDAAVSVGSIQEFDPTTNAFVRKFALQTARGTHGSATLPDGSLIVFGGAASTTATLRTMEIVHQ